MAEAEAENQLLNNDFLPVETRNLWAICSSHMIYGSIEYYLKRAGLDQLNNIFLGYREVFGVVNYDNQNSYFNIRINNIRISDSGFFIDFTIWNRINGHLLFNQGDLHISVHSIPGGPSQTHIALNKYRYKINLKFFRDTNGNIECEIEDENESELNLFIREYFINIDPESYLQIRNLLSYTIPTGFSNIINDMCMKESPDGIRSPQDPVNLMRSQSYQPYQQKYLKYKKKYLLLKKQLNNKS